MQAIHAVAVIFALAGHLFCSGFINGRLGFARLGRQLPPLPSAQASSAKKPALLVPLQADANNWQVSIEPILGGLSVAEGSITASVQKLKALANSQTKPNPELLVDEMDGMVEHIVNNRDIADWFSCLGKLGFQASIPKQRALIIKSVQQLCKAERVSAIQTSMSLEGLFKTGLKLSDLPVELRTGVLKVIDKVAGRLDPRGIANVLKALGKLGEVWSSLPPVSQVALWQSFERNVPQLMNESYHAALTVHSFGQLGLDSSTLKEEQRQLIVKVAMKGINKESLGRTASQACQQTAMTISGLDKMNMPYSGLSFDLRNQLENCLLTQFAGMDARNVANTINSLGQMGCAWSSVSPALQACIQQVAVHKLAAMKSLDIYSTLQGLAKMGAKWTNLSRELLNTIEQGVILMLQSKHLECAASTVQHVALSIHSLGKMSAPWSSFSGAFQAAILEAFILLQVKFKPHEISSFIYGLGCMGTPFQDLSPAFMTAVQKAVHRLSASVESFKPQVISSMLLGFARMDASWGQLPTKELEHLLVRLAPNMNEQEVANSIHSMGKMSAPWNSFSAAFHAAVVDALILLQDKFTAQGVSNFIYGLGCMGAPFQDLSLAFMTAVQKTVHRLSGSAESFIPQDISNIILGFARIGASWNQLPTNVLYDLLVRLAPRMNEQNVANSMYGLTLMCFDFQPTSTGSSSAELEKEQLMWRMIRALVKRFRLLDREEYSKEGINQFAIFFEWVFGLPGGMELITEELGSRPAFINPDGVHAPTAMHLALSQALPKALQQLQPAGQFSIVNEFDGLGGHVFDVDMAVHQDGKLIAFVEVNTLKRIGLLKECLYAQRYPAVPVYRSGNLQWVAKHGVDTSALALARKIIG